MRLRHIYSRWVFPHLTRWFLSGPALDAERRAALAGASGDVLEVGFGSGLNVPCYPEAVTHLVGLDSSREALRLARRRIANAPFPIRICVDKGERLPLDDATFDVVVFTWTLCMIDDPAVALGEARRVLRPEGQLCFLEHGRADTSATARWQDRWNPLNQFLFAGCNINRPIAEIIRTAGFEITQMNTYYRRGPRLTSYVYRGVARKTSDSPATRASSGGVPGEAHEDMEMRIER